jgi:hypothetical protein
MREWGMAHGISHLDAIYLCGYLILFAYIGAAMLQRRDV